MMNRVPLRSRRRVLPALAAAACVAALHGASGCGRADSSRIDSETHWLMSCESDLDCGAGSCECGVCTEACITSADCAALTIAGVECVPASSACGSPDARSTGSASAASAACLIACTEDADCAGLGATAVCERGRCERPAREISSGSGGASGSGEAGAAGTGGARAVAGSGGEAGADGSNSGAALCDGSEDVRFVWVVGGGFVSSYYSFTASRGFDFLAIDGQCRFWRSLEPSGGVSSGTLSAADAEAFASTLDYTRVLDIGRFEQPPACSDGGTSVIWTPESRITCSCGPCSNNPSAPSGWTVAFRTMSDARIDDWFGAAQPVTGSARLALFAFDGPPPEADALPWPLSRTPRDSEIYPPSDNPRSIDETGGVELTDPDDLSLLRAARAAYAELAPGGDYTPLLWQPPDVEPGSGFHMLLRDEVPPPVQAALRAASHAP